MKRIVELKAGDVVPEGAKLINTRITRGREIDRTREYFPGVFTSRYRDTVTYEELPIYVYEIEQSEKDNRK